MKRKLIPLTAILVFALASAGAALAEEKKVIKLKTDDFEMAQTDISHLEIGESETIFTDSGKVIDLLRTADGVEVYLDGEQLDLGMHDGDSGHGEHGARHKIVKVICADDGACQKRVMVGDSPDFDLAALDTGDIEHVIIRKHIEINCDDNEDCEALDIKSLDELGEAHGAIMIHRGEDHAGDHLDGESGSMHEEGTHGEVHVIRMEG